MVQDALRFTAGQTGFAIDFMLNSEIPQGPLKVNWWFYMEQNAQGIFHLTF